MGRDDNSKMNTTSTEPAPIVPATPSSSAKLSNRQRLLVGLAALGAFLFSAMPVGLLLLVAQGTEVNALVVTLVGAVVGSIFAATAGLIAYLIIKP